MNTKPSYEVWSELNQHLQSIFVLTRQQICNKIHTSINNVHIIDLLEVKNHLKKVMSECTGQKLIIGNEKDRFVIIYWPTEFATITIYSNYINSN